MTAQLTSEESEVNCVTATVPTVPTSILVSNATPYKSILSCSQESTIKSSTLKSRRSSSISPGFVAENAESEYCRGYFHRQYSKAKDTRCDLCKAGLRVQVDGVKRGVHRCMKCNITAHTTAVNTVPYNAVISMYPEMRGRSCHDILCSEIGRLKFKRINDSLSVDRKSDLGRKIKEATSEKAANSANMCLHEEFSMQAM